MNDILGTIDIDLALNFQYIKSDTYQTIVETLATRGYYQKEGDQPFRFYRDIGDEPKDRITVEINLLAGEYGGTAAPRRHQTVQDAQARKARGCDLVFGDAVEITLAGSLPGGARNELTIKVAGIGPFLVMKGMALWGRMKEKDAYDIYYCCKNYPNGPKSLAKAIKPLLNNKLAREGLGKIKAKFSTVDGIGPNWVADFLEVSDLEERARIQREAFELTNTLMEDLDIEPFTG
jgi:hypothetical protein